MLKFSLMTFRTKQPGHPALLVENAIRILKRKLHLCMYSYKTSDWPKYLKIITRNINNDPNAGIYGLKPVDVSSRYRGDYLIQERQKSLGITPGRINTQKEQQKLLKKFSAQEKNKNYLIGKYVYLTLPKTSSIIKETTPKCAAIYKIIAINFGVSNVHMLYC